MAATAPAAAQAAPSCQVSGPTSGAYQATVCLTAPDDLATVTGDATVTATVAVSGKNPGIRQVQFDLDGDYLLTDFEAPYTFKLPSDKWADGARQLRVDAIMKDDFVSDGASIGVAFANGSDAPIGNSRQFTPTSGTQPAPGKPFVLSAVGDGGSGEISANSVADRMTSWNPNLNLYLGDVYDKGSVAEFSNWGAQYFSGLKAITDPTIGNHEYESGDLTGHGYFDFWDNAPHYFAVDANGWHIVSVDSNPEFGQVVPGTTQFEWLRQNLDANGSPCTIVFMHEPRWNIGPIGDLPEMDPMWRLLVQKGVDIMLVGHSHSYQRWKPLNAGGQEDPLGGTTQLLVGTGGRPLSSFARTDSRVASAIKQFGAERMELNPEGLAYQFVTTAGVTLDSGSLQCTGTAPDTTAPARPVVTATTRPGISSVELSWDGASDNVGVTGYEVYRDGDLLTRTGPETSYVDGSVAAGTTYSYTVRALDAAGNASPASDPATARTDDLAVLFYSSFETGDLSRWSSSKSLAVQQQEVFSGSWAGRATSTGTSTNAGTMSWAYRSVGSDQQLYAQTRFKVVSQGSNQANLLSFKTGTGGKLLTINRSSTGKLAIRNEVTSAAVTSTTAVSAGKWHTVQGRLQVAGTSGQTDVWLDGVKVATLTTTANFGTTPIGRVEIGDTATNRTYDVAYDEVTADHNFIPDTTDPVMPERLSAQPTSGLEVALGWDAASDDTGVTGYEIFRNGSLLATTGAVTSYLDRSVDPGVSYFYEVRARDGAGNLSHFSDLATVATPLALDDDFETGDLSKWTASGGLTVAQGVAFSGSWAARATSTGTATYAYSTLPGTRSDLYYRLRLKRLSQAANSVDVLRFRKASGGAILSVYISSSGKLTYRNEIAGVTKTSTTVVSQGAWHEIQVHLNTSAGLTEVWVDGKRLDDVSVAGSYSATGIGRVELGEATTGRIYDFAFDDVRLDTNPIADATVPSAPASLTATAPAGNRADLQWTPAVDNIGVTEYEIIRDGRLVARVPAPATTYTDDTLDGLTTYTYEVKAVDAAENESEASPAATVTTPHLDTSPPTAPTALSAAAASPSYVDLSWTAAADDVGVDGYDVYRDGSMIASVSAVTSYRDASVTSPSDVVYTVKARDAAGNRSDFSDPVSAHVSLFNDDFETGDLSRWTTINGLTVGSDEVDTGAFAARATSTGAATYAYRNLAPRTDVVARFRFKVRQNSTSVYLMKFRTAASATIAGLYRTAGAGGTLTLRNAVTATNVPSSAGVALGVWHELQLRVHVGSADGRTDVWLDGTPVAALSGSQALGTTAVGRLQLGEDTTQRTYDVAFDGVRVDP
jgi:fibronectin type 3 domain-containing protein